MDVGGWAAAPILDVVLVVQETGDGLEAEEADNDEADDGVVDVELRGCD